MLAAALLTLLAAACSGGGGSEEGSSEVGNGKQESVSQTTCSLSRRYMLADTDQPARSVSLALVGGNASASTNDRGRWSIDVGQRKSVVVRVESTSYLRDNTSGRAGNRGSAAIPSGVAEVTYQLDDDCNASVAGVKDLSPGRARGRPQPPPLPDGFKAAAVTLSARVPSGGSGKAANVPWTGSFWTTAPVVTVGICGITDAATKAASEAALRVYQEASNLGWQLKRDDRVCDEDVRGPKMLIKRERDETDEGFLGFEYEEGQDTPGCDVDANPTNCWIDVAYVTATPPAFDDLSRDEKVATMLHEIGHGLGLGHATVCAESIMWADGDCERSNQPKLGADDIASLNELLSVTLNALRQAR